MAVYTGLRILLVSNPCPSLVGPSLHKVLIAHSPIQCETATKNSSGASVSFADNWNRLIARSVLDNVQGSATWSGLQLSEPFRKASFPFPILLSNGQTVADNDAYYANMTVYEMTPYEFGSWDPINTGAFIPMDSMGSTMSNGKAQTCLAGLDNSA